MRTVLLLFSLATTSFAQETYIIPVFTTELTGPDRVYRSTVTLINVGQAPVRVVGRTFSTEPISPPCLFAAGPLQPGGLHGVLLGDIDFIAHCRGRIFTVVLNVEEPLLVRSRVESIGTTEECFTRNFQEVPIARDWLPSDAEVVVHTFEAYPTARANLFLTNPNPFPIEVVFTFERDPLSRRSQVLEVAPESLRIYPLPALPEGIVCGISPCPTLYRASLKASGSFYAGISSVFQGGGEIFFPAVAAPAR